MGILKEPLVCPRAAPISKAARLRQHFHCAFMSGRYSENNDYPVEADSGYSMVAENQRIRQTGSRIRQTFLQFFA